MTIVSHRHRCIFVAVPKNASHAIRFALRPHLGPTDEEQVSLYVQKRINHPIFAAARHGHQTASEVRAAVGQDIWSRYCSFAVVRNPWARFVSYVAFMKRDGEWRRDPRTALWRTLEHPENQSRAHFRPQSDYLTDEHGARRHPTFPSNSKIPTGSRPDPDRPPEFVEFGKVKTDFGAPVSVT